MDPDWTEKVETGKILDPLHLNQTRGRILNHLLFGITSIAITQRLRYISFSLWVFSNLQPQTEKDIIPYEKIFLLANLAHPHGKNNNRDDKGLSGKDNIIWSKEELNNPSKTFPISDDAFEIQQGNSTAFSQYYKGLMQSLLLLNGLEPTPLGKEIANAFDQTIDVEFNELEKSVNVGRVSSSLLQKFGEGGCCCKLSEKEKDLFQKVFLGIFSPVKKYKNLKFNSINDIKKFNLEYLLADNKVIADDFFDDKNTDDYLNQYFINQTAEKRRESLLYFLGYSIQNSSGKSDLSIQEKYEVMGEIWKSFRFYDYFLYSCESALVAVLLSLRSLGPIYPEKIISEILNHPAFGEVILDVINPVKIADEIEESKGADALFDYIYYRDLQTYDKYELNPSGNSFEGSWLDLKKQLIERIDPSNFSLNHEITESRIKNLIDHEIKHPSSDPVYTSARIFGLVTVLLNLLKLRYDHQFSKPEFKKYWEWMTKIEDTAIGPNKILKLLEGDLEIKHFMKDFFMKMVVKQHIDTVYSKMTTTRIPRLFSMDFLGRLEYQETDYLDDWSPTLSLLKFQRITDIFYELDFIKGDSFEDFKSTKHGEELFNQFKGGSI